MEQKVGYTLYGDTVGILMLDMKAPLPPGNVGNAKSYNFPVRYKVLTGIPSDWWNDEEGPSDRRCGVFIEKAKELEAEGCKAITSGCGFFAIYQERVANAVNIPVFLSPLLMVPMVSRMIGKSGKVAIITANGERLSQGNYLPVVGIEKSINYVIGGMEACEEFTKVHVTQTKDTINPSVIQDYIVDLSLKMVKEDPDIRAFIFECSDLPPYAKAVARASGKPVFDFITLAKLVYTAIEPVQYLEY